MRQRCVWTLIATVLWLALVQAETRIEVDEQGNEYELKRFYIQGRQLNGGGSKSQCVVTRRKRSSRALPLPSNAAGIAVSSQQLSLAAGPEHREALPIQLHQQSGKRRYVALTALQVQDDDEEDEDDDEEDEEEDDEEDEQQQQKEDEQKLQQQQHQQQASFAIAASAAHLPQGVSVLAQGASHTNVVGDAGIVVVESEQPPKVNPSTHAVFELKPLQAAAQAVPELEQAQLLVDPEDDYEDDEYFYYGPHRFEDLDLYDEQEHFISENSPVSTTAIWSTGEDDGDIHPIINEPNQRPSNAEKKKRKKRRKEQQQLQQQLQKKKKQELQELQDLMEDEMAEHKPAKEQKKRKQQQQQPAKKPASNSSSISGFGSSAAPVKRKQRPSSSNSNKRKSKPSQKKKKKKTSSSSVSKRRRRPSSSSSGSSSSSSLSSSRPLGGYRRRRPQSPSQQQRRRLKQQQQQKRRRQEQQRRRRRRNKNRQNANNRRQYFGDEPIINCIYINKDPPTTTTQRPFWNILGRDAGSDADVNAPVPSPSPVHDTESEQTLRQAIRRSSGDFGHRKRTNLKFVQQPN